MGSGEERECEEEERHVGHYVSCDVLGLWAFPFLFLFKFFFSASFETTVKGARNHTGGDQRN